MRCLIPIVSALLLTACGGSTVDTPFTTYLDRLGRTLDEPVARAEPRAPVARPPRTGELRIALPLDSLGALDFLELRGCDLQVTVGKRNSSLGRLARDSQRLLLELEFLQLAPACIAQLREEGEDALAKTLGDAATVKREQLPALLFNATLASEEYRRFWRPPAQLSDYPDNISSEPLLALETVNALARRWLAGDYHADNEEFELALSAVAAGDGGALWRALAHQGFWLAEADALLARRHQRGPLCPPGLRPDAADILPNVVRKFFIDDIQPRAAVLGRRFHELLPPVQALETLLADVLPEGYRQWQLKRDAQLQALAAAPRAHVLALTDTLASCENGN